MQIAATKDSLASILKHHKKKKTGFVPTMGALHKGHMELIKQARNENDVVVCSIFVNPTQFNDKKDLENYPRTLEADLSLLEKENCDIVFTPSSDEMYPHGNKLTNISLDGLDATMEGQFRPGHFAGMITIVDHLLRAVNPTNAYFGEKDFQQLAIIRHFVKSQKLSYNIVGCKTVREPDGLAYSSRNVLLNKEQRAAAPFIYKTLLECIDLKNKKSVDALKLWVQDQMDNTVTLKTQYIEFVNSETLHPLASFDEKVNQRACIAVFAGTTRLIDNIAL